MVLLPEGKIINNPDSVKLIKVLPTTVNDETFFVVAIKLDDDSELMVDRCATRLEAEELANRCCSLLNGEAVDDGEIPSFVGNQDEDSSDWEDSEEDSDTSAEEDSSSWDVSSSEDGEDNTSAAKSTNEEASSSWELSSSEEHSTGEAQKESAVDEESSSWELSSSDEASAETSQSTNVSKSEVKKSEASKVKSVRSEVKPKIQKPYTEEADVSLDNSVRPDLTVEPLPRVTAFIEGDSDEWIQDNGLDDWYD